MSKSRIKLGLWGVLSLVLLFLVYFGLQQISLLLASFQQGADPATALNVPSVVASDLDAKLEWLPDEADVGRKMEPFTRTQIEAAYLQAWLLWNISFVKGEPYGLKTYFVGPALEMVSETVEAVDEQGWRVNQVNTDHRLQLHFYSADGSIVAFTDTEARTAQAIWDATGTALTVQETAVPYDVVMFLEDGNWRVRHWVRREPLSDYPTGALQEPVIKDKFEASIKGINYYPQETPWDLFWSEYDSTVIANDLAVIRDLELNSVRIFIPFAQFGGTKVLPEMLEHLADFLDQADENNVQVIVTLFDFRTEYQLLLWAQSDRHLETLLTTFADHPAILAWDIKNEPDLDYASQGKMVVDGWLAHTLQQGRLYAPNQLFTIGWSSPETAVSLATQVDFVSFHYYAPAAELSERYEKLRTIVPDKPLLLGEFGLPTWNSFFFPNGHTQPEQAVYYADVLDSINQTDSVGYFAWTLYDFDKVPSGVAGRWPWQIGPQKKMGILQSNGESKLAVAVLMSNGTADIVRPPEYARFLKPFWLTLFVFSLMILGVAAKGRKVG